MTNLAMFCAVIYTISLSSYCDTPGSLSDVLKRLIAKGNKGGVLHEVVIATILREALQGLEYLHTHGLIHRFVLLHMHQVYNYVCLCGVYA